MTSKQGLFRVTGPPGTGKTTWLSRQVGRAIKKHGSQIGVVSFTKAAAVEAAGRGLPIPDNMVGTLHSMCYRAFGSTRIFEIDGIKAWNAEHPEWSLESVGKGALDEPEDSGSKTQGESLCQQSCIYRARMLPQESWADTEAGKFYEALKSFKHANGFKDFTDLIEDALDHVPAMPGEPEIIFVDEAQDFSPLELALVRKWGERANQLIIIGDELQCLYGFKGSTPEGFLTPELPPENEIILKQSWRLPKEIHEIAVSWISRCASYRKTDYLPREGEGECREESFNTRFPDALVDDAIAYSSSGKSVMFLASCGYMLDRLKHEMRQRGLPFHNPYRKKRGDWNPLRGVGERIRCYLRPDFETFGEKARVWTGYELNRWADELEASGTLKRGAKKRLVEFKEHASEPMDMEKLAELFEPESLIALTNAVQSGTKPALQWLEDHSLESKRKLIEYPIRVARDHGGKALAESPKIILGTIHSVKGGEADRVYLFPDLAPNGYRTGWGEDTPQEKDAIRRMFYVGMTRARESLILCQQSTPYAVNWAI